jgi:GWxTD domain-containing protein
MKRPIGFEGVAGGRLPLILFALLLACLPGVCLAWDENQDIPGDSRGDILFNVDIVTFYDGPGKNIEEINCTVPNQQISFVERDGTYYGKLRYKVIFTGADKKVVKTSDKTVEVTASSSEDAGNRTVIQVLQSSIGVAPGKYAVTVMLEDLNARKRTLLSYVLRRRKSGHVEMAVDSRDFRTGELALSDIEFARSLRHTTSGVFQKSSYEVVPNAERRYGIMLSEMAVFFEVYDLRAAATEDSLQATYSIVNREGMTIFANRSLMALHGARFGAAALFDITSLTSGSYALTVEVSGKDGAVLAATGRRFDVVWSILSWGKYDSERLEDMAYVFTEKEMKEFKALSLGEQEKYLVGFWARLDPTPETRDNEAMIEHYRRVAYADAHFGTAGVRGAVTDRGRIYIKYGPADDVQSFYSDYEFVRDKQEIEGESVPTDPFARVGLKASQQSDEASSDQRGGSTVHGKPYETWAYDGPGNPVRRLSERVPTSAGLRFMFADDRGIGDYRLIYSSEKQEY